MSHSSPLLARGPGHNLLSSSLGFLLLVGWGLVKQSSLKGNQSVGGRRKGIGGTQLFLGLEEFKEAKRPGPGWWTLSKTLASDTHLKMLLWDFLRHCEVLTSAAKRDLSRKA